MTLYTQFKKIEVIKGGSFMPGLLQKIKDFWNPEEVEEFEDSDEENFENNESGYGSNYKNSKESVPETNNRVVNIRTTAKLKVVLFKPERFGEEIRDIADELLKVHTIVLNLENTSKEATKRIIDFLSGAAYAIGGKITNVATETYVITPYNVDITGDDLLDKLKDSSFYF